MVLKSILILLAEINKYFTVEFIITINHSKQYCIPELME